MTRTIETGAETTMTKRLLGTERRILRCITVRDGIRSICEKMDQNEEKIV